MRKSVAPPPPRSMNGNGSISAEDSDSTSGESLEGSMELGVMLPDGKCVRMSIEKRTPMMDLLVQVTKANGLSPGSFVLDVKSERGRDSVRYKPSTAVGSLNTGVVYVVPKSLIREVTIRKDTKTGNQPFEKTFRLRVHLPRNQLHVLRVSQSTPLVDVFGAICTDRELNPARYELRHPVHTEERLDPQRCLADYGLSEVAMVAVKGPSSGFSRSSSDIMSLQHDDERKKHRFFGFMFKKSKSSKSIGDNSSDGHSSRGVSPTRSDGSGRQSISPPLSTAGYPAVNGASHNNNNNVKKTSSNKKRPAPPPPKAVAPPAPVGNENGNGDVLTATSHSRHSSDSSGYHEASILSDSIETTGHDIEILALNRTSASSVKKSGAPPSNLTTINSTSMLSVSSGPKKRKAPAPPSRPVSIVLSNDQEHSASILAELSESNGRRDAQNIDEKPIEGHSPSENIPRKDSVSSHASSAGEEVKSVTTAVEPTTPKKVPKPVPLPRLQTGKVSPSLHVDLPDDNVVQTSSNGRNNDGLGLSMNVESPMVGADMPNAVNGSDVVDIVGKINVSSSDGSDNAGSALDCTRLDSNRKLGKAESVVDDAIEIVAESRSSLASNGNMDTTSSSRRSSALSQTSSQSLDVGELSNKPSPIRETDSKEKDSTSVKRIKEISVQTNFEDCETDARRSSTVSDNSVEKTDARRSSTASDRSGEKTDARRSSTVSDRSGEKTDARRSSTVSDNSGEKTVSGNSSRRSSNDFREDRVASQSPELADNGVVNAAMIPPPASGEPDILLENGSAALSNDAVNEFYNHFNSRKKFVANSWARYVNVTSSTTNSRESRTDEDWVTSDDEELFSLDEHRNSDAMSENRLEDYSEKEAAELNPDQNNLPISAASSPARSERREEQWVKEVDVTALSAQIDKAVSEHKIAAEIDEAFASIDMMDSGSDAGSNGEDREVRNEAAAESTTSEVDPVITWEYRIPEVPAQFQNDYEDKRDKIAATDKDTVTSSIIAHSAEPPLEQLIIFDGSTSAGKKEEEIQQIREKASQPSKENTPKTEKEPVEVIYKRPVMSFSISTYKSRVKEESEYGHKLAKTESFSQKPPLTKAMSMDSSALIKPVVPVKQRTSDSAPGHSLSIAKAIAGNTSTVKEEPEGEKVDSDIKTPDVVLRKAKSELRLDGQAISQAASGTTPAEQELLQQEYLKLHSQFLQWQQQLLQNQTVLQQQQILPESATETLQRIQELQQQFLASKSEVVEKTDAPRNQEAAIVNTKKTNTLPRPKSAFAMSTSTESADSSNSLERKLPRVGPRPWIPRPVAISLGSWQPMRPQSTAGVAGNGSASPEPAIIIEDKVENKAQSLGGLHSSRQNDSNQNANPSNQTRNVPTSATSSVKDRESSYSRQPARTTSFPRHPVVKGFASVEQVQPQKSKVMVNGPQTNGGAKQGVVRVNIGPQTSKMNGVNPTSGKPAVNTFTYFGDRVDNRNDAKTNGNFASREYDSKNMANAINNNNNNVAKKSTTVVVNSAPSRQQSSLSPPPPPPPPTSLPIGQTKISNGQANRKSVSTPESDEDIRDGLMLAIRGFGGRHGLKKVSSAETGWQTRHGQL